MNRDLLIAIQKHTDYDFVEVKDGVVTNLDTDETIPVNHMGYQKVPADGLHRKTEATCGGSCSVGTPSAKCVKRGIYSAKKCAVWFFEDMNYVRINVTELESIIEETNQI